MSRGAGFWRLGGGQNLQAHHGSNLKENSPTNWPLGLKKYRLQKRVIRVVSIQLTLRIKGQTTKTNWRFSIVTSWWFQPIWNILVKVGSSSQIGMNIKLFETTTQNIKDTCFPAYQVPNQPSILDGPFHKTLPSSVPVFASWIDPNWGNLTDFRILEVSVSAQRFSPATGTRQFGGFPPLCSWNFQLDHSIWDFLRQRKDSELYMHFTYIYTVCRACNL